jgi:hypothetical protein
MLVFNEPPALLQLRLVRDELLPRRRLLLLKRRDLVLNRCVRSSIKSCHVICCPVNHLTVQILAC